MIYFCTFAVGLLVGVIIGLLAEQHQAKKDIEMRNGQIAHALSLSLLVKWRKATGLSKPLTAHHGRMIWH